MEPLEDPVLSAYAKCLQNDILCVWRRSVKHSEQRPADTFFGKELWIFWYGDKPSVLDDILTPDLKGKGLTAENVFLLFLMQLMPTEKGSSSFSSNW